MTGDQPALGPAEVRAILGLEVPTAATAGTWREIDSPTPSATLWEGDLTIEGTPDPVACLLYRPTTPGPWPAVVAVHQHNGEFHLGKSEPAGIAGSPGPTYGRALAEAGFLVVMPDLDAFESRARVLDADDPGKYERLRAMNAVAQGRSMHADHVREVLAIAYWLNSQDDVRGRATVVGHSLGAQVALLTLAVDAGIDVGVVSCGMTTFQACRDHDVLHNPGWYLPGLEAAGGYLALARGLQGKRFLAVIAQQDVPFPVEGAREMAAALPPGVADVREHAGPHDMTAETRAWLSEWLAGHADDDVAGARP